MCAAGVIVSATDAPGETSATHAMATMKMRVMRVSITRRNKT
jgi:hypothetical protein